MQKYFWFLRVDRGYWGMRNVFVILCAAAGLTLAGYASGGSEAEASEKPHIQAVFKKGSKVCTWTDSEGNKGTDYFYKDKSALSGSADRVMGKDLKQGTCLLYKSDAADEA